MSFSWTLLEEDNDGAFSMVESFGARSGGDGDESDDDDSDDDDSDDDSNSEAATTVNVRILYSDDGNDDLRRNTKERIQQIGLHSMYGKLRTLALGLQDDLQTIATTYSDACRDFYNTVIIKTTQDSTRTTLESIVAAKSRRLQQEMKNARGPRLPQEQGKCNDVIDLANIATAVKVFGDRQDVLAKQIDARHCSFRKAREQYHEVKIQLERVALELYVVCEVAEERLQSRRYYRQDGDDYALKLATDEMKNLNSEINAHILRIAQRVQRQLHDLRKDYYHNQPSPPIKV